MAGSTPFKSIESASYQDNLRTNKPFGVKVDDLVVINNSILRSRLALTISLSPAFSMMPANSDKEDTAVGILSVG